MRKRRSTPGESFLYLSRERLTWRELFRRDRAFVAVVSALLAACGVGVLLFLPLWRSSPPGFQPVYRVSGIGRIQEGLAIRAARTAEAQGEWARATEAWRRAVEANPGDADNLRRFLRSCIDRGGMGTDPELLDQSVRQSHLLLRLGGTNHADLELAAAVAHAAEKEEAAIRMLSRLPAAQLTPAGRATLAGAYFQSDDFPSVLEVAAAAPAGTNEAFLVQRTAAALVVAGSAGPADWDRLTAGDAPGGARMASLQAQLVVASRLAEEGRFNAAWAQLEGSQGLRARDHVRRWQLLARLGRMTDAANAAKAFEVPSSTAHEAIQVVRWLDRIGMASKAIRYGEVALERHRDDLGLWREVGRLMVRGAAPELLIRFASILRRADLADPQLGLASYYVGVAEHHLGHPVRVEEAFGEAAMDPSLRRYPILALECADTMRQLGYPDRAERILQGVIADTAGDPVFWVRVLGAAREARSESWVLDAARREQDAHPAKPEARRAYLDALLLNRTNALESLNLATRLRQEQPHDVFGRVALARALALQGHWAAVEDTLSPLDDAALRAVDIDVATRCHLARGEALVEQDRRREAASVLSRVDTTRLFPDELARLQVLRDRAR